MKSLVDCINESRVGNGSANVIHSWDVVTMADNLSSGLSWDEAYEEAAYMCAYDAGEKLYNALEAAGVQSYEEADDIDAAIKQIKGNSWLAASNEEFADEYGCKPAVAMALKPSAKLKSTFKSLEFIGDVKFNI